MLPDNEKYHKDLAKATAENLWQLAIDEHFKQEAPEDKPILYSDACFKKLPSNGLLRQTK